MANNDISFQFDIGLASAPSMGHQSTVECFVNDWHALVSKQMFEYITLEFLLLFNTSLDRPTNLFFIATNFEGKEVANL